MDWRLVLGSVALAAFWIQSAVMTAAALLEWKRLRSATLGPWQVGRARTTEPGGVVATQTVIQVGRSRGDGRVWFHDRKTQGDSAGGSVRLEGQETIEIPPGPLKIWIPRGELRSLANRVDPQTWAIAEPLACKARGYERTLQVEIHDGEAVFVSTDSRVLSRIDPYAERWRAAGLCALTCMFIVGSTALCSWLILKPPLFGTVSAVGAVLALVTFNLDQLFGKLLRDALKPPERQWVGGAWRRPSDKKADT